MAEAMIVADYIIDKANELGKPVNNLKLQKIMFFLNVEYLLEKKESLVPAHKFEKWSYGPVVKQVFRQYRSFGSDNIRKIPEFNYLIEKNGHYLSKSYHFKNSDLDNAVKIFINSHINLLVNMSELKLTNMAQADPQWKNKTCYYYTEHKLIECYSIHHFW